MNHSIRGTSWPLAVAVSLLFVAIPFAHSLTGETPTVRALSLSEMRGAVGLQAGDNGCHEGTTPCSGQTTEWGCSSAMGCLRCTESTAVEMQCGAMAGSECTTDPPIPCGVETQGTCNLDECCEDPCPCDWPDPPNVTNICGTMIEQCHNGP